MTPEGKNEAVCFGKIRWQLPAEGGSERVRLPKDARCPAGTLDLVGPPLGLLPVPLHGHQEGRARVLPVPSPRAFQRGVFLATSTEALQPSACPPVFAALIHRPPAPWEGLWAPWRGQDPPRPPDFTSLLLPPLQQVHLIVDQALKRYSEDRVGMVDYALESAGRWRGTGRGGAVLWGAGAQLTPALLPSPC